MPRNYKIHSREQLPYLLVYINYKIGVEVGVEKGEFTKYLLDNTDMFIYGVDSWRHIEGYNDVANISDNQHQRNKAEAFKLLESYGDRCKLLNMFSVEASESFEDESVDFVYIDANHSYREVKKDIEVWSRKVRKGGMLAGHDFMDGLYLVDGELSEFGVASAVYDYLSDKHYRLYVTEEMWPTWYIIKE